MFLCSKLLFKKRFFFLFSSLLIHLSTWTSCEVSIARWITLTTFVSHLSPRKRGHETFCFVDKLYIAAYFREKKYYPSLRAENFLVYIGSESIPHTTCFIVVQRWPQTETIPWRQSFSPSKVRTEMLILIQGESRARHLGQVNCAHWKLLLLKNSSQLSLIIGYFDNTKGRSTLP